MNDNKLEVGDKIYQYKFGKIYGVYKITRVSEKYAYSIVNEKYEVKFRIDVKSDGLIEISPAESFSQYSFFIENEDRILEFKEVKLKSILKNRLDKLRARIDNMSMAEAMLLAEKMDNLE